MNLAETIGGWLGGLLFVAAAFGGTWLHGYAKGQAGVRAEWAEATLVAERAARQTETDLRSIAEVSARRIAEKERLLHERARRQDARWRALLAGLPGCAVPGAVGVQLDAASGVPNPSELPGAVPAGTDEKTLDTVIELSDTLDRVRANYEICRINIERLTAVRDWYNELRDRVND